MKRMIIIIAAAGMLLTSCGRVTGNSGTFPERKESLEPAAAAPTEAEAEKHYSADGKELNINMAGYTENAKLYTANDICLLSYDCGYISYDHPERLVIEDQEQLDFALERYGLVLPDESLSDDELWRYNTAISGPFNEMTEKYPVSDYTYVVEYDEVSCGGYSLHAGALLVDEELMHFVMTADSKYPDPDEPQCDVMGGFCYMAAVPKGMLPETHYKGWVYPDAEDMYQDRDFVYTVSYAAYKTRELYDVYGDTGYIIRNAEELKAFTDMSADVKDDYEKPAFYVKHNINFENAVLFCRFFSSDFNNMTSYPVGEVTVSGDTVLMGYEPADGRWTGVAYAAIPKRFLPEKISPEWKSPEVNTEELSEETTVTPEPVDSDTPEEGYIAVFHGGTGERTYETYVYSDDGGYRYVNMTSTTVSWGSTRWNRKITDEGRAETREDVVKAADANGASQFVVFMDDPYTVCEISEFMEREQ